MRYHMCIGRRGLPGSHRTPDHGRHQPLHHPSPELRHHGHRLHKNEAITAVIKALVDTGIPLPAAYDAVLGQGSYQELAGEVWAALQPA